MNELRELYQETILDHYRHPETLVVCPVPTVWRWVLMRCAATS